MLEEATERSVLEGSVGEEVAIENVREELGALRFPLANLLANCMLVTC